MPADNPAFQPCRDIDKGPEHQWVRRADGTATCLNCGCTLNKEATAEAFEPPPNQVNKKAGGVPDAHAQPLRKRAGKK